jgi:competence protein ComEC
LLLGVKTGLGEEYEAAFRETGIIHIVVLSGYNIALVIAFVLYALAFCMPLRGRLVCGLIAIVCFALLVGLSATVVRASIMAALLLCAQLIGRTYDVVRALLLAGVLMLVHNPFLLVYDVGFQLSFMATLGLIVLAPWIEERLARVPTIFNVREYVTATIAAQVFVTPLLLYHIGQFSVVALLVNVLVLPMVPVAMLLTFCTGMIGFVSTSLAEIVAYPTYLTLSYIIYIADWFASVPFASFIVPTFSFWWVVGVYVCFASVWYWYMRVYRPGYVQKLYEERDSVTPQVRAWTIVEEEVFRSECRMGGDEQRVDARMSASTRSPTTLSLFS